MLVRRFLSLICLLCVFVFWWLIIIFRGFITTVRGEVTRHVNKESGGNRFSFMWKRAQVVSVAKMWCHSHRLSLICPL